MNQGLTRQQFVAAAFLASLSPMIRVLPRAAVLLAGPACWLCPLAAFVLLALYGCFLFRFLNKGRSLGELFLQCLGPGVGRPLLFLYGLAFLFYAGFILRVGADRLMVTVYPTSGPAVFYTVLLLLGLMASLGTLRALGRAAVILRWAMLGALGLAFLFSLPDLNTDYLGPVTAESAGGILWGALPVANIGGLYTCFSFLDSYCRPEKRNPRLALGWLAVFCGIATLLCIAVVGSFGSKLTVNMSYPFFVMVRNVSLLNLAERIEAFVVVLWVLSDFMLCSLLLRCAHEALRLALGWPEPEGPAYFSPKQGRWLFLPEAAAVWCTAHFITRDSFGLLPWSDRIIPAGFALFSFGFVALTALIGRLRKKI